MSSTWTRRSAVAIAVAAALGLPGCSHTISGTAATTLTPLDAVLDGVTPADPVPTDSPLEGFLPNGGKIRTRENSRSLPVSMDAAVQNTVKFWRAKGMSLTVRSEAARSPLVCGTTAYPTTPAVGCADSPTVKFDTEWEQSLLANKPYGVVALEITAAHEVGHKIQDKQGLVGDLNDAPRLGVTSAAETSADCLAGVYMKSTGVTTEDLDRALALTALAGTPVREQAFREGLSESNPPNCIDKYLG